MTDVRPTRTRLRGYEESDREALFSMFADRDARHMAAFVGARDPDDRVAFDAHLDGILASPANRYWIIVDADDAFVGMISTFPAQDAGVEVTYWVDRAQWGRGHATRALLLALQDEVRPVGARIAADNVASRRVLEKAGFRVVGRDEGHAPARGAVLDELILRLG